MTRVFEALEQAERDATLHTGLREFMDRAARDAARDAAPALRASSSPLEDRLVEMHNTVSGMLRKTGRPTLAFVSHRASAGASVLAAHYARVAAEVLGRRTLLVRVDNPPPKAVARLLPEPRLGLGAHLDGRCTLDDALAAAGSGPLHVSSLDPAGGRHVAAVFDAPEFDAMLAHLIERFDLVLFDPPPLADAPDALPLAGKLGGVVLVIEAERTRWQVAEAMKQRIAAHGGAPLGVLVNKRRHHIPAAIYRLL